MSKGSLVAQRMVFDGVINVQYILLKNMMFSKFKFPKKLWYSVIFFWSQSELEHTHWRGAHVDRNMLIKEDDEKRKHEW